MNAKEFNFLTTTLRLRSAMSENFSYVVKYYAANAFIFILRSVLQ